ncbi:Ribophorin I, partial [Dimargaris cristalligena]
VYSIELPTPLAVGQTIELKILVVHTQATHPFPRRIGQFDSQSLRFDGNAYLTSLYFTHEEKTVITLRGGNVHSYSTDPQPVAKVAKKITYGPYRSVPALAQQPIQIHYPFADPGLWIPSAVRHIEISHWAGQLSVDEHVVVRNNGALLKGNYQMNLMLGPDSTNGFVVNQFILKLPKDSHSVYFRDEVGNVSTTNLSYDASFGRLQFVSRYPLAGGWIYNWNHGYKQPLADVLRYDGATDRYNLQVRLPTYFPNAPVEEAELEVVLPEGATDIQVSMGMAVESMEQTPYYTYMDSVGRPLLRIRRRLVVDEHQMYPIIVSYRFDVLALLLKPLALAGLFFGLFLLA